MPRSQNGRRSILSTWSPARRARSLPEIVDPYAEQKTMANGPAKKPSSPPLQRRTTGSARERLRRNWSKEAKIHALALESEIPASSPAVTTRSLDQGVDAKPAPYPQSSSVDAHKSSARAREDLRRAERPVPPPSANAECIMQ